MITERQFQSQISRISALFAREISKEAFREMYELFKNKDFPAFKEAISDIIRNEDRFPSPNVIQGYYNANVEPAEKEEYPSMEDLERAAKTDRARFCLDLIKDLLDEKTTREDPRFKQVEEWHREDVAQGKTAPLPRGMRSRK